MDIECPHCAASNAIEFAENICCHKCKKSFAGFSFRKFKSTLMGSISVLLIGAFAGHKADQHFLEPKRYSTAAIYEIVSYCANPKSSFITKEQQQLLAHTCICALNKTMAQVAETELKERAAEFKKIFRQHSENCQ